MYPTLYHAVQALFGLELQVLKLVNMLGLMVMLGALAAGRCLISELERKHADGTIAATRRLETRADPSTLVELWLPCLVAFVFGYKLFGIISGEFTLQGGADARRYMLSSSGDFVGGLLSGAGWAVVVLRGRRRRGPEVEAPEPQERAEPRWVEVPPREHLRGIVAWTAVGGLLGGKLFHLLERPRAILELIEHPSIGALFSGHTFYGGAGVGALCALLYCRRAGLPLAAMFAAGLPGVMLAYGMGRLGCHLAGDGDWGIASPGAPSGFGWLPPWFWAFDYPNNVIHAGVPLAAGGFPGYGTHLVPAVYPTPLYESLASIGSFAVLWFSRRRIEQPLSMVGLCLVLNGIERLCVETIRVNATYDVFGRSPTQAEIVAALLIAAGTLALLRARKLAPSSASLAPKVHAPEAGA
jgi:prolipoprotein diacylglyceryltransferase